MNAVVTGATKGIGRAIVELLAEKGANVAFNARNEKDLASMGQELSNKYPAQKFVYQPTDMSKQAEVLAFGKLVKESFKQVDILVNNAGVFMPGMVTEEEDGALETMIDTNVYSAYHLTRSLVKDMIDRKTGHIFNMCSVASLKAYPHGGSYSISKFALYAFSQALRDELKEHNIRVTSIHPGATLTASWEGVDLPEERFMKAKDVAKALWDIYTISERTVVEDIVLRPQLGDI